jgi:L-ascorbate metabolism protein UlaG (beta-lactamase superfamily)
MKEERGQSDMKELAQGLGGAVVTWLGHATIHMRTAAGTSILIDPWIEGNPSFPKQYRMPERIDLLLITHGHDDHFHDAVPMAKKYKPKVVGIFEVITWMQQHGVSQETTQGMNLGGSFRFKDVTATMVEAKHSSSIQDGDKLIYGGNPAGYMLALDGGPSIYVAGDTSLFGDMQLFKELYAPALGILPIGDNYTMGPKDAAMAAKYLGLKQVLPVHYGTFPALTGSPAELSTYLEGSNIEVLEAKAGEEIR